MLATFLLAAAAGAPPCWNLFDAAMRHSAAAARPAYVTYDERISIEQDDAPLIQSLAHVEYRDDGLARVRDERFNYAPVITRYTEPGPPVLGPYGGRRAAWLPQVQMLRTISSVRAQGDMSCNDDGVESYKDRSTYHLTFTRLHEDTPGLKAMWIDTATNDIWKVIISGYVPFADDSGKQPALADYEVELTYAGPYLVVDHVVWQYTRHLYAQSSTYFAEYTLSGYNFPASLPPSDFAATTVVEPR